MAEQDDPTGRAAPAPASPPMSVKQAIEIIDSVPVAPRVDRLPLAAARGYRLAGDVTADGDYPPFDKAVMDGYAVRSADVKPAGPGQTAQAARRRGAHGAAEEDGKPVELAVVGEVAAGRWPDRAVGPGEAVAIMTGAPMPEGADAVVPIEDVGGGRGEAAWGAGSGGAGSGKREAGGTPPASGSIRISRAVAPGAAVARRGSDCAAGAVVLARGTELQAAQLAAAATVGAAEVRVFARPNVGVLGTGDELIPFDQSPGPAQIRNSNTLMLVALLQRLGCEVTNLGTVPDDPAAIRRALEQGLRLDALFVTGGMSMGAYDYVPRLLAELGVELKITKVRLKPGKPFVFGVAKRPGAGGEEEEAGATLSQWNDPPAPLPASFVFGLPGNPVSAFVCTVRLASRLLARLGGGEPGERWITGRLETGLPANGPREFYQPVVRYVPPGGTSSKSELSRIRPLHWKGSADLFTLAKANALLVRGENEPPLPQGTLVRVLEV